ncbi:MAG TPA: POTRA domain-containing protein [Terriglobales bacterium]|nr:POTRA domain-containing protein [Terriglobales bacterium]
MPLLFPFPAPHFPGHVQPSASGTAQAQIPAAEQNLVAIKVTGSKRYTEQAIAAETGLQLGVPVTEDDFKKAAVRLGDTGAFSDIAYHYSYSSAGTKLELQVTDTHDFVPAHFEDFVWFTDAELRRRIKERVPLFDGEVPLSGRMADEISDVLQAMLVEGAIPGHVDYMRVGKEDGPTEAVNYRVSDVLIRVRNIEFTGAAGPELPALKAAGEKFPEPREYSRSRLNLFTQRQLLPVYLARGYLKASFSQPQPKAVGMPTATTYPETMEVGPRNLTLVDVTFAVTPGAQYKLKSLTWSGNHEFPADQLRKLVHAEVGQPADTVRLAEDLKDIQKLYGSRGFITASLKANARFDDAADTVAMTIDVKEGFVYHMGDLEFRGLDNGLTARLRDAWKIRPGDVYDANYLQDYLPQARKLLPPTFDWEVSSHVTANLRDKTVDVDLIYTVNAPR